LIRAPIVVVGGHVDHGKTTLLDYLRGTIIAEKEAGRITQHIGATEIPLNLIQEISGELLKKYGFNLKIPGLLFIDTPGHEAFSSLRKRGCSIADIGVLIIDILQGVQPQTIEVINYLKENKVPFVIALTKVDKLKGFDFKTTKELFIELDENRTQFAQDLNEKLYAIMAKLSEFGLDSDRYDNVADFTKKLLLIPVSSKTGFGMPELLLFLSGLAQKFLEKNLTLDLNSGKAVVLEINEVKGFGKTADVILYDGKISKNDIIKIDSQNNFNVTKVKQLLLPTPLSDLRTVKSGFLTKDTVGAASGLKIVFNDPELISAGDELQVITKEDADKLEITKKEICTIKEKGIVVKVDTQGSLDAIMELACKENIAIGKLACGNFLKEDVLEAKLFGKEDPLYSAVFVFNQKLCPEVEQYAKEQGVKIFSSNVVYKLFEEYKKWAKTETDKLKEKELQNVIYPAKLEIFKDCIFRKNKPAVFGVKILDGILKSGAKLYFNNKVVGTLKQIQLNGKTISEAKKGDEVAISSEDLNFEKDIDLNITNICYIYIPSSQRGIVKKYLYSEFKELIDELFEKYVNSDI
jgi:translation initiation factor 5B